MKRSGALGGGFFDSHCTPLSCLVYQLPGNTGTRCRHHTHTCSTITLPGCSLVKPTANDPPLARVFMWPHWVVTWAKLSTGETCTDDSDDDQYLCVQMSKHSVEQRKNGVCRLTWTIDSAEHYTCW